METKTPNFHPPPLLMAAMHPLSAPPAARPALRVRSPRSRTGRVRHSCLDRNLDGEEKREREKEKKTATTQPISLGVDSDFALYVAESVGFYVFPPLRKNTGWHLSLSRKLYCYLGDADIKAPKRCWPVLESETYLVA
ncbi:hypothetical protein RHMOL_Rhmol12G0105300 [Rhododendron molle]|uniref:Uncharacterized protein n=1 Tax=Rhododendron molle TaxID=49168 RepID=A0ACC0LGU3_RHOML|nr:hypothetical protein RHMOL_Rhmol12G0105300 [Rhododendron molle]